MVAFEDIFEIVKGLCAHGEPLADDTMTPRGVKIHPADVKVVCSALREHATLYFDMLSCLTAIDNGPEAGTIEVVYNLYSIPFDHYLSLKVALPRDNPEIDSVEGIWKTANWHEREAYDLLGVVFSGHPDLRRILLPADWQGHPLRKDYQEQAYYRGVKVGY